MHTLTVDDNVSVVNMVLLLLNRLDPAGTHLGFTDPEDALKAAKAEVIDVALLDVEMPTLNGIELATRLQDINPLMNIIFITGYMNYMPRAFNLYASGYIMKPVTEGALRGALVHLRYRPQSGDAKPVEVRCFGTFEVFVNGKPVRFNRSKSKELFAYLVDRRGAVCTTDTLIGILWPDEPYGEGQKSNVRNCISDMTATFKNCGVENVILRSGGGVSVNRGLLDCDYYRWLDGDPEALHQYLGEYMSQYEFAEETRYQLGHRIQE